MAKITKAYVRRYTDTNQVKAYVEWLDARGRSGRTEGSPQNTHMLALFARAQREGLTVTKEVW